MLRRFSARLAVSCTRSLTTVVPSEHDIISAFRHGNYQSGVTMFARRPAHLRSNTLCEAAILACAQIPDAPAAHALLKSMKEPTYPAIASVVNALCRESELDAAASMLESAVGSGLVTDRRLSVSISRAADRSNRPDVADRMTRLPFWASKASGKLSSSSSFAVNESGPNLQNLKRTRFISADICRVASAERRLHAAVPRISNVDAVWESICNDCTLRTEVGVIAAAVASYVTCGGDGPVRALNTLMTWVQRHIYDSSTQRARSSYTSSPSAMALLITATTKALSTSARSHPALALSAYDTLIAMHLPSFETSLPLTGAYLKVLQHSNLSLSDTCLRIHQAWRHHIQFDEQAFSIALGAILRCDARVSDKLEHAREWVGIMHSAGIPLTAHTYNLFAGQLRYCNDPQIVTTLLSDMKKACVKPTAVTYGLIFSSCVMHGDYRSRVWKNALPVSDWVQLLQGMEAHMTSASVSHTSYSLLSLARSYAHLGQARRAMTEFNAFIGISKNDSDQPTRLSRLHNAFHQMMYNLAHCRDCSAGGPDAVVDLFEKMVEMELTPSGNVLDALLVACVRTGRALEAVQYARYFSEKGYHAKISVSGMDHLLKAHMKLHNSSYWEDTSCIVDQNKPIMSHNALKPTIKGLVMQFARCGMHEVCEDIMNFSHIRVPGLDYVYKGKEFSKFRTRGVLQDTDSKDCSSNPKFVRASNCHDNGHPSNMEQAIITDSASLPII